MTSSLLPQRKTILLRIKHWLGSVLMAGIAFTGASPAQPPQSSDRKEVGSSKGPGLSPPTLDVHLGVDDVVARIIAFDKNKDGKVTKDELPERMHHRIDLGDTNKDGALDKEEIIEFGTKAAAAPRESELSSIVESEFRTEEGGGRPGPGRIEVVVNDLKLSGKKKELAIAAARAHQEHVRKLMEQARGELFKKMKEILTEEELKDFAAALDRPRDEVRFDRGAPAGVERKLELPLPQKR
jgi:EF hand